MMNIKRLLRCLTVALCVLMLIGAAQAEGRTLQYGMSGDDVQEVQERLIALGYLTGMPTVKYDANTRTAVNLYQAANGIKQTGTLTVAQQSDLMKDDVVSYREYLVWCPLSYGKKGEGVMLLQARLSELGYYTQESTGSYDRMTQNAVKEFQAANGIRATGTADTATRECMNSQNAVPASAYYQICALSYSQKHPAVTILQERLAQLGYYTGELTGAYDKATKTAVTEFQTASGIRPTGTADTVTRQRMIEQDAVPASEYYQICKLIYNQKHPAVKILQERLAQLGYYTGEISGAYDKVTRTAVIEFQTASGIKATGTADTPTRERMNERDAVTAEAFYRICELKYNQKHPAVLVLQTRLAELGYYTGEISGTYNKATRTAVTEFQAANGLRATGTADTNTRRTMDGSEAKNSHDYYLVIPLKYNTSSAAVRVLKTQLTALGYYTGEINDLYDRATKAAVTEFQTANGVRANGSADAATRTALNHPEAVTLREYNTIRPLSMGNTGEPVHQVQTQLRQLGFYTGEITDKYDAATRDAVKTFQLANAINSTGKADTITRKLLNGGQCVDSAEYDTWRPLKIRDTGSSVALLQTRLFELGYYCGSINSTYDTDTRNAVKVFQSANGFRVTGSADVATRKHMLTDRAVTRAAYDANRTLQKGESGITVMQIQERLATLGYYTRSDTVLYDSQLVTAVKTFQTAHGLKVTGSADVATRLQMFSSDAVSFSTYSTYCAIKYGEKGSAVGLVQRQLYNLGYYTGTIDEYFGSALRTAVKLYQTANGLYASGNITEELRQMLNTGSGISLSEYLKICPLQSGSRGEAVIQLQSRLIELGYYNGKADGVYGTGVVNAVKLFQTANNIKSTGIADTDTRKVMNSSNAITKAEYDKNNGIGTGLTDREKKIETVISVAMSKMGCKYVHYSSGPNTFDCSNFTKYCFAQVGIKISGSMLTQGYMTGYPKIEKTSDLKRGDLLIFDTVKTDDDLADHAGIYLGDGTFIHCSSARGEVVISDLKSYGNFSWAFRLI